MNEKELYRQKKQAQLDEWQAEVERLKAKAAGAGAGAQRELNEQIEALESKIKDGRARLSKLADASEGAWHSLKEGVESAWDSMDSAFRDAAAKFKEE